MDGAGHAQFVNIQPAAPRLPEWLRQARTDFPAVHDLKAGLRELGLHTVCESARCPNLHECFARGAATFMILGNLCTRGGGFCSVPKSRQPGGPDPYGPAHVRPEARERGVRYGGLMSVSRGG